MKNRTKALPPRAVWSVDIWRRREAEAGARDLDRLLYRLHGDLPATASPTMGEVVLFREGSAILDAGARASLGTRLAALSANPGIRVVIGGFASHPGSTAYGMGLGLQRVQAVRDFLLSQGIGPGRIEVAIRGPEWFLVERSGRSAEEDPSGECRFQIADPQWALVRN